ncbi:MAG: hypothetical protein NTV34_02490 [Proteobacteria bacterium]|nr:hypothetical protein [Pseudomonadota bacterium]
MMLFKKDESATGRIPADALIPKDTIGATISRFNSQPKNIPSSKISIRYKGTTVSTSYEESEKLENLTLEDSSNPSSPLRLYCQGNGLAPQERLDLPCQLVRQL